MRGVKQKEARKLNADMILNYCMTPHTMFDMWTNLTISKSYVTQLLHILSEEGYIEIKSYTKATQGKRAERLYKTIHTNYGSLEKVIEKPIGRLVKLMDDERYHEQMKLKRQERVSSRVYVHGGTLNRL